MSENFFEHAQYLLNSIKSGKPLPPEIEEGPFEYKYVLNCETRRDHLASQLLWRIREGCGHCWYLIGVTDIGNIVGLEKSVLELNIIFLYEIVKDLKFGIDSIEKVSISTIKTNSAVNNIFYDSNDSFVAFIHITSNSYITNTSIRFPDKRILIVGRQGSGKTTLIGALSLSNSSENPTFGESQNVLLDDGRGKLTTIISKHRHELISGVTSSITMHALQSPDQNGSLVFLMDTAGSIKYMLKNAIAGITTTYGPDAIVFLKSYNNNEESEENQILLDKWSVLSKCLNIPLLKLNSKADLMTDDEKANGSLSISAVTSEGLEELIKLFYNFPLKNSCSYSNSEKSYLMIEECYLLRDKIIIGGVVFGNLFFAINETCILLPSKTKTKIVSIKRQAENVEKTISGRYYTFAIEVFKINIKNLIDSICYKGAVLIKTCHSYDKMKMVNEIQEYNLEYLPNNSYWSPLFQKTLEGFLLINGCKYKVMWDKSKFLLNPSNIIILRVDSYVVFVPSLNRTGQSIASLPYVSSCLSNNWFCAKIKSYF